MKSNINALVYGFCGNYIKIMDELQNDGIINLKVVITDSTFPINVEKKYFINDFFTLHDFLKYKEDIYSYEQDVPFNHEVYEQVYQVLFRFSYMYSRHDKMYQNKSLLNYIEEFNLLYGFFYSILIKDKINMCFFSNMPHEGPEFIIYNIAKALGIPTLIFSQAAIPNAYNKSFFVCNMEEYGDFPYMKFENECHEIYKIKQTTTEDLWYMKNYKLYSAPRIKARHILKTVLKLLTYGIIKRRQIFKLFYKLNFNKYKSHTMAVEYINHLKRLAVKVDYTKKYVYFPLHLQPELTTSSIGRIYFDQMLAIEIISKMLPKDWLIYVKENPKQTEFQRSRGFFERLELLKNVRLVPRDESSAQLIQGSQFTATITGTAGWEALTKGKPVLVFGNIWYQNFEGAFKYDPSTKDLFNKIISKKIDMHKLEDDINMLLKRTPDCCVDREYIPNIVGYDETKNFMIIKSIIKKFIIDRGAHNNRC